jgi:hypothetical protein
MVMNNPPQNLRDAQIAGGRRLFRARRVRVERPGPAPCCGNRCAHGRSAPRRLLKRAGAFEAFPHASASRIYSRAAVWLADEYGVALSIAAEVEASTSLEEFEAAARAACEGRELVY